MALVPPGVVTVTSTTPVPGGTVAEMEVAEATEKAAASAVPNLTDVAPRKSVPLIRTVVPPDSPPRNGLMDVTVGNAT